MVAPAARTGGNLSAVPIMHAQLRDACETSKRPSTAILPSLSTEHSVHFHQALSITNQTAPRSDGLTIRPSTETCSCSSVGRIHWR